jgi:hypothetical protein
MPDLPDMPGKGLLTETTKRARLLAGGAAVGLAAAGGFLLKRKLGQKGGAAQDEDADPIAKAKTADIAETEVRPPKTTGTDAPPKPEFEPGNISGDKEPHHALNNPIVDPDETEYPDPFEKRDDPRDPVDPDGMAFGDEPHPPTGAGSTSEPHPGQDPEAGDRARPPKRENLDD